MLPSLPILAGQGFIIRAAQKSTASRVAKDRKAFVLNISTGLRFPRWTLCNAHTLLIIGICKATSWPHGSTSTPAPDILSRPLLFPGQAGCSHSEFRDGGEQILTAVLELQWRAISFSDTFFWFVFYLFTFVTFPHFSAFHGILSL